MSPIYDEELEDLMTFGISSKGYVYSWDINKKVRAGSPINLDKYIPAYDYSIPEGMSTEEIVGMAIAKSNDYVYTWYQNNNRSIGHTNNLIDRGNLVKYYLPKGYKPEDVIGMGISNRDIVYTWYKKNGVCTVSAGNTTNLASLFQPSSCELPVGSDGERKSPDDILGLAINNKNVCYAWYKDGTMSAGWSRNLYSYINLQPFLYYSTMSLDQITEFINNTIQDKKSEIFSLKCSEPRYVCPSEEELRIVANEDSARIGGFLPSTIDTDIFSYFLKSAFIEREYKEKSKYPYCLGLLILTEKNNQEKEIYNIAISSDGDLLYIDHQGNDFVRHGSGGSDVLIEIPDGKVQFIIF